jgi:pimeloyl-ACP methyl ester carboxylesterase
MYRYARKAGVYYKNYSKTKLEIVRFHELAVIKGEYSQESIKEAEDPLYFLCLYDSLATFQIYDALQKIKCPALIMAGEYDKVADIQSLEKYAQSINNSLFHIFKESGHHPFQEEKKNFLFTIKQFVERKIYE